MIILLADFMAINCRGPVLFEFITAWSLYAVVKRKIELIGAESP